MNNTLSRIIRVFVIGILSVTIVALVFFKTEFNSARTLTKADSLSGQRIGVVQAYEADYILTNRSDVTLLRYETEGDSLVGLCYEQIDGLAYVEEAANYFLEKTQGLKIIDGNLGKIGYTLLFSKGNEDLLEEFNEWTIEYLKSDRYKELKEKSSEITDGTPVTEETGTGKTIIVGYIDNYIPISFLDMKLGVPNGVECETIRYFANDKNYKIKWVECTESSGVMSLHTGAIQIAAVGYTDVYREELEETGSSLMAQPHMYTDIKILVVDDWDNLSINSFVEEEE